MESKVMVYRKRVFILILIFMMLSLSSSFVYGQWTSVTPPSGSYRIYGVYFTPSSEGWAVGRAYLTGTGGLLLHYSGGTWTSVTPPIDDPSWLLYGVHFTSSSEGWAVGHYNGKGIGALLHYSGGTWTSVTPPTIVSSNWWLNGVYFASSSEGWAVGNDYPNQRGVLLHYSGGTWISVTPPTVSSNWELRGVHFTSSSEGWAVGTDWENNRGVLLHYSRGTWTSVTPPTVSSGWELFGVHFTSSSEGWAVGYDYPSGLLLHYSRGTWTSVTPPSLVTSYWYLLGVHFTSSTEGWAVGNAVDDRNTQDPRGVLLHYYGGTWTSVTLPSVSSHWELYGVHFTSSSEGWAVGYDGINPNGVLLKYLASETISTPTILSGPDSGGIGIKYTYSTGGSSSNIDHPVQYLFDWGDGTSSGWLPVGQSSASKSWPSPGTYDVRAQARCSDHTSIFSSWSEPLSVTIFSPPSPPTNVQASDGIYLDRVRVTWSASLGATSYTVYRATSSSTRASKTTLGSTSETFFNDTTAVPMTTYYYYVKASNAYGTSDYSSYGTGYRSDGSPAPPTNISASDGTYMDRVQVTWTASLRATSYTVYRTTSTSRRATKVAIGTTSDATYNDTTASVMVTYYYYVTASNSYGTSGYSAYDTGFRSDGRPSIPTNVQASDGTYTDKVQVTWTASLGATSYSVYRATSTNRWAQKTTLGTTSETFFNDTTASAGVTYYYYVTASNSYGASGYSAYDTGYR